MFNYANMASCHMSEHTLHQVFVSHFTIDAAPVSFETKPTPPPRGTNLVDDVCLTGYIRVSRGDYTNSGYIKYRIRDCIGLLSIRRDILKRKHGRIIVSLLCDVVFKILAVFVLDFFVLFCFSDFSV